MEFVLWLRSVKYVYHSLSLNCSHVIIVITGSVFGAKSFHVYDVDSYTGDSSMDIPAMSE